MGRFASTLLGGPVRIAATGVVALVLVVGVGAAAGVFGAPQVVGVDNRFGDVNESTTTVESDLHVHNPNPAGVQLGDTAVEYGIAMNDVPMANGTKEGVAVGSGNATLAFTTYLDNERIPAWWVSHLRNGEHTTVAVDAAVHSSLFSADAPTVERDVDTDVASSFDSTETRPIDADQPVVADPVLYVNETSGEWGEVTDAETPIEMTFTVYNPNPYPVTLSSVGYDVAMNDVDVGSGESERELLVPPGETRTVEATTVVRNQRLDEWWVTHLERDQVTDLEIQFYAQLDLSEVGAGTVRVPVDTMTHTIETDIFGTKNDTDAGATSSDGTTDDRSGTPTPTPSDSATEAPTETEDGGLVDGLADTETAAETTETPTDARTPTEDGPITTDDGGLLG